MDVLYESLRMWEESFHYGDTFLVNMLIVMSALFVVGVIVYVIVGRKSKEVSMGKLFDNAITHIGVGFLIVTFILMATSWVHYSVMQKELGDDLDGTLGSEGVTVVDRGILEAKSINDGNILVEKFGEEKKEVKKITKELDGCETSVYMELSNGDIVVCKGE